MGGSEYGYVGGEKDTVEIGHGKRSNRDGTLRKKYPYYCESENKKLGPTNVSH